MAATPTHSISFAAIKPTTAANVPHDFVGFGFETAFFNQYDSAFSHNLIDSIASRMSTPPIIRIGGTSGDLVSYDPQQIANATCLSGGCPNGSASSFSLGPTYFDAFKNFKSARFTFQVPLEKNGTTGNPNIAPAMNYLSLAYKALGKPDHAEGRLQALALGNEVDQYEATGADYVPAALMLENAALKNVSIAGAAFEVCDTASGHVNSITTPSYLQQAFEGGINKNGLVKYAADHYYQIDGTDTDYSGNLQTDLMNHTRIVERFTPVKANIAYLNKNFPNVSYVLSETGSSLEGDQAYSDAFGACLWSVDFQLYAMSNGVARVDGSQRPTASHSLWIPVDLGNQPGPAVRAPFYAQPYIADFIGSSTAAVAAINLDLKSDILTAYAMYESSALSRIALVNLREWDSSFKTARGNESFAINVPSGKNVTLSRLHADAGASAQGFDVNNRNITWAGMQWSINLDTGKGVLTGQASEHVNVTNGIATVYVPDSEAIIVSFSAM